MNPMQQQVELAKFEEICLKLDVLMPYSILSKMDPKRPSRYLKTLMILGIFDGEDSKRGRAQTVAYAAEMLSATNGSWNRLDFKTALGKVMGKLMPELTEADFNIAFVMILQQGRLIKPA